jgi:hypothetical protein
MAFSLDKMRHINQTMPSGVGGANGLGDWLRHLWFWVICGHAIEWAVLVMSATNGNEKKSFFSRALLVGIPNWTLFL